MGFIITTIELWRSLTLVQRENKLQRLALTKRLHSQYRTTRWCCKPTHRSSREIYRHLGIGSPTVSMIDPDEGQMPMCTWQRPKQIEW
ncbi:hypothetical protein PILCRDRAFT_636769 [Piloderma croceum F 1598]|uniref:Uncharacterized protein n=1 Tax=Piloderma croceum (strain F 1598) TaxID=765440 RepID=A0A0C3FA49_PILCF|nr:hypothetical protein PILCRDRAFT_636769 [Piloderma croceum F 1598]